MVGMYTREQPMKCLPSRQGFRNRNLPEVLENVAPCTRNGSDIELAAT